MFVGYYDPAQRARDKAESRLRDEESLAVGLVSREELQFINGGNGIFRNSVLVRQPRQRRSSDAAMVPVG